MFPLIRYNDDSPADLAAYHDGKTDTLVIIVNPRLFASRSFEEREVIWDRLHDYMEPKLAEVIDLVERIPMTPVRRQVLDAEALERSRATARETVARSKQLRASLHH